MWTFPWEKYCEAVGVENAQPGDEECDRAFKEVTLASCVYTTEHEDDWWADESNFLDGARRE